MSSATSNAWACPPSDRGESDTRISRFHAEIICEQGSYIIRDKGSRCGTYVNGELITQKVLENGDRKILAGGMSLIPLMKLRLASPAEVVDLSPVGGVVVDDDQHPKAEPADGLELRESHQRAAVAERGHREPVGPRDRGADRA